MPFIQCGLTERTNGILEDYQVCRCDSKVSTSIGEKPPDNLNVSFANAEGSEEI